ncbi:MAG: LemA family protein [bacterium]
MNDKIYTTLGIWGFLFLGYFTISDLHLGDWAIFIFLIFVVAPHCFYIASSKKIITRLFIVTFGNLGITFFAGNKSYWDFILENILQIVFGVTVISVITLVTYIVKGFYTLKANDKVVLARVNELNFIYQGRVDMILRLIKNLPPQVKQSSTAVEDLVTVVSQFSKINEINSIIGCLDIIEKRLFRLFEEIFRQPNIMNNQAVAQLIARLTLDEKDVLNARVIYNHCANDFNESMSYFPVNLLASVYNLSAVKKLKVEIAKMTI